MRPAASCLWIPVIGCLGACAANPAPDDDFMAALVASALAESAAAALPRPALPAPFSAADILADPDFPIDSIRWHGEMVDHRTHPRLLAPPANAPPP